MAEASDDDSQLPEHGDKSRIFSASGRMALLRQFSMEAESMVENVIGAKMKPGTAVIFMLNSLTGLSLLTLPYGFNQAGLLLGAAILFGCMAMAFITATFMCEALTIANALHYEEAEVKTIEEYGPTLREELHQEKVEAAASDACKPLLTSHANTIADFLSEARIKNADSAFKIRERVELGAMGEMVLHSRRSKKVATGIYIMVLSFTYGTASALVVTVNQSLAHTTCNVMGLAGIGDRCDASIAYHVCVIGTFFVTLPLCFTNLQKTKRFTMVIMVLRFTAIFLLILVSSVRAARRWRDEGCASMLHGLPLWRSENFMAVFGNAVFLFGIHHYIPGMIAPLEPQRMAPRVIGTAFCICYGLIVLVCATAMLAWGGESHSTCSSKPGGHFCTIQPIYNLNFAPLDWAHGTLGLFILTYPTMAIASMPIAAITSRNTLGRWLGLPAADPEKPYAPTNVLLTLAVLVPPFSVALVTTDVQAVIQYVGGYSGLTVAILCPLILVIRFRRALKIERATDGQRLLKSPFANRFGYFTVIVFFVLAFVLVTKKLFFPAATS